MLEALCEWLRIASVSSDPARAADVERAARWVIDSMEDGEWEHRPPLVVGRFPAATQPAPHLLLYAHYDVQPAGPLAAWETPPFEPTVRDGWLHARGAADSKANALMLLTAACAGPWPVNLTVLLDGEEEVDGAAALEYVRAMPAPDAALVCDGSMWRRNEPTVYISTRGQMSYRVSVRTGRDDLHSGRFGGAALNAVHALMGALTAATGLPGELGRAATDETWEHLDPGADVLAAAGAVPADGKAARDFYARTLLGAAVDVSGIHGGEPDQQMSSIPVRAHAQLSLRLGPGHDPEAVDRALRRRLQAGAPAGAELSIERLASVPAAATARDSAAVRVVTDALRRVFGTEPLVMRNGATVGVTAALAERRVPTVMTGFAVPGSRVHGANERFPLDHLELGLEALTEVLSAPSSCWRS